MKHIIEDIKFNLNELQNELKLRSYKQKNLIIRKHAGGICTYCGKIPTKKLKYDVVDRALIELYCDTCLNVSKRVSEGRHKKDIDKLN